MKDALAALLAEHGQPRNMFDELMGCPCGKWDVATDFDAHVAAALAPRLREALDRALAMYQRCAPQKDPEAAFIQSLSERKT